MTYVVIALGVYGLVANRKNLITVLISLELLILGINLLWLTEIPGEVSEIVVLLSLGVSACEAALALGLMILYFRVKGEISLRSMRRVRR